MLLFPNVGRLTACNALIGSLYTEALFKLYTNDYTPDSETVIGDLEEADWAGYAPQSLSTWGTAYLTPGERAATDAGVVTVPNTSGDDQEAVGCFIVNEGGDLLAVERFPSPLTIPDTDGRDFSVTLTDTNDPGD